MKIRYKYPVGVLVIGLMLMGLYFGVIKLREWADPPPNLAFARVVADEVRIEDQPIVLDIFNNNNVYADAVTLAWPGFLAAFEPNGELVGSSRFIPAGLKSNVRISLVKQYKPGETLIIKILRDSGDSIFNLVEDFPVKDKFRKEIAAAFRITGLVDNSK